MTDNNNNKIMNVPQQVFDLFLKELKEQKVPEVVVARLKKTLIDNEQISVEALMTALFSNDDTGV